MTWYPVTYDRPAISALAEEIVEHLGERAHPPLFAVAQAEAAARASPCAHSRRGVSAYVALGRLGGGRELVQQTRSEGYNGPPWRRDDDGRVLGEGACDGSSACQRDCARRCVHAEARAISSLADDHRGRFAHRIRLVHVKVGDDGRAVRGKGPCCVECSKAILDQGIGGVWLYEELGWRYYAASDFHDVTEGALGMHHVARLR